jgi:hypothetical protein
LVKDFFYIPILRQTTLEGESINIIAVVAKFVTKSDLWKTFDKIPGTKPFTNKEKFPSIISWQ